MTVWNFDMSAAPKRFTRAEVLREIDRQIRIPRGYEPIMAED